MNPITPVRPGLAGVLVATAALLTACGGGGEGPLNDQPVRTVSMQPLSLVLRPGETETVRSIGNADGGLPRNLSADFAVPWLTTEFFARPCRVPAPNCLLEDVSADAAETPKQGDRLSHAFTNDPSSRVFANESYLPVAALPSRPAAAPPVIRFAAGGGEGSGVSIALDADGMPWFWGDTGRRAIGPGLPSYYPAPVQLAFTSGPGPLAAIDVSLSGDGPGPQIVALARDGAIWTWGYTALRADDASSVAEPLRVPGIDDAIAVAAGAEHALALRADGTVWAWGRAFLLGTATDGPGPAQVAGLSAIVAIAAGRDHSLALRDDGTVWAWGVNSRGQAGSVSGKILNTPRQVMGLGYIDKIDAGDEFSIALHRDGTVWAWGSNAYAQLGADAAAACELPDGKPCSGTPVRAAGLDAVDTISAGGRFSVARKRDGSVWAWGDNGYGQLGGLPGLGSQVAVQVPGLPPVLNIAAGARHALAMPVAEACAVGDGRTGGRLMAWGDNFAGERGDATAVNHLRPTPVLTLGDDDRCRSTIGRRLVVYLSGIASGTVTSNVGGLICRSTLCWQTVADGTPVTLTALPAAGAKVADWRWDCAAAGTSPSATLTINAVHHCKIRFTDAGVVDDSKHQMSLTVTAGGRVSGGSASLSCGPAASCSQSLARGTVVQLEAIADTGFRFVGFTGDAVCSSGHITLTTDTQCTASFEAQPVGDGFLLTVQRMGGQAAAGMVTTVVPSTGINCGEDCSERYAAGTFLLLVASVPSPSVFFSHWTGCTDTLTDDEGRQQCLLLMNSDHTVQASFE